MGHNRQFPQAKGMPVMASKDESQNAAGLRGPGDPEEIAAHQGDRQPQPGGGNIREEQQTQAAGTVPASFVGTGDQDAEHKPEDAAEEPGMWDGEV